MCVSQGENGLFCHNSVVPYEMGRKSIILAFTCLVAVSSALAQLEYIPEMIFPVFRHPAPGYYLIAPNATQSFTLIDHSGKNVFPVPYVFPNNMLCTDSTLTYFDGGIQGFV